MQHLGHDNIMSGTVEKITTGTQRYGVWDNMIMFVPWGII